MSAAHYKSPRTKERLTVRGDVESFQTRNETFGTSDGKGREHGQGVDTWTVVVGPGPVGYADYDLRGKTPCCGGCRLPVGVHYAARLQSLRGGKIYGAFQQPVYFTSEMARDRYVAQRLAAARKRAWKGEPCLEAGDL